MKAPELSEDYSGLYGKLHSNAKMFRGHTVGRHAETIAELVSRFHPEKLLDYGSGKGHQYLTARVHEKWGGLLPHVYDPGVKGFHGSPEGPFDGVICVDVMEHIAEADVPKVLDHIFALLPGRQRPAYRLEPETEEGMPFAFFAISIVPATKNLPDGRNAHLTQKPGHWWEEQIAAAKERTGSPALVTMVAAETGAD